MGYYRHLTSAKEGSGNTMESLLWKGTCGLVLVCASLLNTADAQTDIHRCSDADGNVVFSQLPCEDEAPDQAEEAEPEAQPDAETDVQIDASPTDATATPVFIDEPLETKSEEEVAACKKRYRDAIDAIDAEIASDYSPENAEQYKERLLALTRQLRAC